MMITKKQARKIFNQIDMRIRFIPDFPDCPPDEQFVWKFAKAFHDHFRERIMAVDLYDYPTLFPFWDECHMATSVLMQNETALAAFITCEEYVDFEAIHASFEKYPAGELANEVWQSLWLLLIAACVMMRIDIDRYEKYEGLFGSTVACIQMVRIDVDKQVATHKEAA